MRSSAAVYTVMNFICYMCCPRERECCNTAYNEHRCDEGAPHFHPAQMDASLSESLQLFALDVDAYIHSHGQEPQSSTFHVPGDK